MKISRNKKRRVAIVIAVMALAATTLGSTFAYQDYKQHKSNELRGETIKYEARLVEDFAEVNDWNVSDGPVTKKISVVNLGMGPEYGSVYVRMQLKEYMEIGTLIYSETPLRYMIDTDGEFVVFAAENEAIAATAQGGLYAGHSYKELTDAVTGKHGFFIETKDHDPNGQMGKYVIYEYTVGDPEAVIKGGPQQKAASTNHHGFPSGECDYAIHSWKAGSGLETREYIEWQLNTGAIITITEWLDPNGAYKGMPVDKWVVDDTNDEGWVYWGRALEPGTGTSLFMESVTLVKQPDGSFYYVIHTDMQAVSLDELVSGNVDDWGDAGNAFVKNSPKLAFDGETPKTVKAGETVNSPRVISTPDNVDPADLVWTSSNPGIASVDKNGVVTGVSEGGPVTITVKAPNGAKTHYTVTVLPADAPDTAIPLVTDNGGGYTPVRNTDDPMDGDGLYVKRYYPDLTDPNNNAYYHDGAIHLEDVISDGNYSGLTAAAADKKYEPFISVGTDHHGKPSILYTYVPSSEELLGWIIANGDAEFTIKTQVELARADGKTATITINMYYWDCSITLA